MKRVLYEKRGRRYYPVAEYDQLVIDALPKGHHLVSVEPGVKSVRYDVNPDHAGLLAALREHRGLIIASMRNAAVARHRYGAGRAEKEAFELFREASGGLAMWETPAFAEILLELERAVLESIT